MVLGHWYPVLVDQADCMALVDVRRGMAISWPKVINDKSGIRNQSTHVIDIMLAS
jgi:hypothetical protein